MKRFTVMILGAAVFFLGIGALVENAGAKFKSDEKALDLVRKARIAIGGDAAINGVQSMRIVGQTTRTVKIDGIQTSEPGETEIALQFPDKMMKMVRVGRDDGSGAMVEKNVDVVVVGDAKDHVILRKGGDVHLDSDGKNERKLIFRSDDGTVKVLTGDEAAKWVAKEHPGGDAKTEHRIIFKNEDGTVKELTGDEAAKWIAKEHAGGEGVHTFTFKKNADGTVTKSGDGDIERVMVRKMGDGNATFTSKDGKTVNSGDNHFVFERSDDHDGVNRAGMKNNEMLRTTLGLLLTAPQGMDVEYTYGGEGNIDGTACNIVVASFGGQSYKLFLNSSSNLPVAMRFAGTPAPHMVKFERGTPAPGRDGDKNMVFLRKMEGGQDGAVEMQVKFSDYRSVNGVLLPFRWTQSVGGKTDETFDVTNFEINPANIAEKFQNQKVMVRTSKPVQK